MITIKRIPAAIAAAAATLVAVGLTTQTTTAALGARLEASTSATAHTPNWAGAVTTNRHKGTFQGAAGNWRVPCVTGPGHSSTWVGVDGYGENHLIQTGTEEDFVSGRAYYYAWFEILPQEKTAIPIHLSGALAPVGCGDEMFAYVMHSGRGIWTIHLADKTQGWKYDHRFYYSTPERSAEWIQEGPSINNQYADPAHFGSVTFTNLQLETNGHWHYTHLGTRNRLNQVLHGHLFATTGNPSHGKPQTVTIRYSG